MPLHPLAPGESDNSKQHDIRVATEVLGSMKGYVDIAAIHWFYKDFHTVRLPEIYVLIGFRDGKFLHTGTFARSWDRSSMEPLRSNP